MGFKILATADWHIGQFKGPVVDGVNLRSQDTVECLEYMVEIAKEEKPEIVCVSGDIFHQEQVGPVRYSQEVLTAAKIIRGLAQASKCVVVMRGTVNHDGNAQFQVLEELLSSEKKVSVVTSPTVIQTPLADIACIPGFDKQEFRAKFPGLSSDEENAAWTKYISDLVLALRAQCRQAPVLMAHYTVPGCNMESGQTCFFTNFEPVIPREALTSAGYEAVLLGHIHRPQAIDGLHNVFYAGAVNALNFNDEGQRRGFWIHEFNDAGILAKGNRYDTPYRQFQTISWEQQDVADYLREGTMYLHRTGLQKKVADKIVRVRYSCDSEQKKQLNIPVLQKELYDLGAFYVADIEAESMVEIANRGLLSEESDPMLNLRKWLDEKGYRDPDRIVELAEPIIAEAMKQSTTAEVHGTFRPVSIFVRNYRNYREESFDFSDISFCTINGTNGAGKSSLFMDAIVDCLFEETREGDSKAWIRGTEDARSGSIEFVFDIGEDRFRVVRTRTKSGKPTLNLSKQEEGEWTNLSKERIADTQAEIEKLLGMDSMTFKSCALIMQDQYGLFLQARKDERMAILGSLLGLGIYSAMEQGARKRLADEKRDLASKKDAVRIKTEFMQNQGNPEEELESADDSIRKTKEELAGLENSRKWAAERIEEVSAKKAERERTSTELEKYASECRAVSEEIAHSKEILAACERALESADLIREKAEKYRELTSELPELEKDGIKYDSAKEALKDCEATARRYQNSMESGIRRKAEIVSRICQLAPPDLADVEEKLKELERVREELQIQKEKQYSVSVAEQELSKLEAEYSRRISEAESRKTFRQARIAEIRQQEEFLKNSGCPDIGKAGCRFLKKAIADVAALPDELDALQKCEKEIGTLKAIRENAVGIKRQEINCVDYDPKKTASLEARLTELMKYQDMKREADERKLEIARLEAEREANDKIIEESRKNLSESTQKAAGISQTMDQLTESVKKLETLRRQEEQLRIYVEQERSLPAYEERKLHAQDRVAKLEAELQGLESKKAILYTCLLLIDAALETLKKSCAETMLKAAESQIRTGKEKLEELQIQKGILLERIENVEKMRGEIALLDKEIAVSAGKADGYEALKQAFSQDGVPHQIIRNIIPHITDTANNILGQMTGGTMGVEFVMERTVKGKDGDKATLDVLIDEYGKTTLPYASKSGGEKVKASLAVILALSEIKATAAGVQMGMLFIDEAPFLDSDGTQAYVDALETIRTRYPDTKIMAITHDPEFKAMFPQSVFVYKDENGSHVRWG